MAIPYLPHANNRAFYYSSYIPELHLVNICSLVICQLSYLLLFGWEPRLKSLRSRVQLGAEPSGALHLNGTKLPFCLLRKNEDHTDTQSEELQNRCSFGVSCTLCRLQSYEDFKVLFCNFSKSRGRKHPLSAQLL